MATPEIKRVLKASEARAVQAHVAFNYEDLKKRCENHVEKIRQQTQQMLRDAHEEGEHIRREALENAKAEGWGKGMQDAEAEIERRATTRADARATEMLSTLYPAMQKAVEDLIREQDRWLAEWESAAIRLSIAIAEKLLKRQLELHPERAKLMISEALQLAAGSQEIHVRLSPQDVELLGAKADEVIRNMAACGKAIVVADPEISVGSCLVETQHGVIDARVDTMLDRIAEELAGGPHEPED